MKKTTFRLLGLFLAMFAMTSQPVQAEDFINSLRDFFNEYYNGQQYGDRCYSQLNGKSIGEGKVYVEWAKQGTDYTEEYVGPKLVSEIEVSSPDDDTANNTRNNSTATHKYVFCAKGDTGWEFEGLYENATCTTVYNPNESETHEDGFYGAKVQIPTSATNINNKVVLNLFARFALNVTLNKYGYSTLYYSAYNFTVPSGVTAFTYKLDNDNKLVESTPYAPGDVIPAGEAVVLQGTANATCKFIPVTGTYTKDGNNLLRGSDEAATTQGGGKYYALSAKGGKVGFYWMAEGGAAFTNGAHKAYLVLPSSGVKSYAFDEDDATAIMAVESADEDGAIYNVAGQRLNKMQKGINIVNGKKILKK